MPSMKFEVVPIAEAYANGTVINQDSRPVVLVVDDEKVIADTLAMILSKNGFTAFCAYSGRAALDLARVVPPQLLISDVVMPGMSGVDLALELVGTVPDCRVLLFSGQASTVDLLARANHVGRSFKTLAKPLHPTDLLMHIAQSLNSPLPVAEAMGAPPMRATEVLRLEPMFIAN
jgi:DNA-binding response OmpR family regulator